MDEEYEIIMVTFEDFKNDIISKNDKIKSKDEYWWVNLKNDLLLATNRMIAKKLNWDINRVTGRVTELRDKGNSPINLYSKNF